MCIARRSIPVWLYIYFGTWGYAVQLCNLSRSCKSCDTSCSVGNSTCISRSCCISSTCLYTIKFIMICHCKVVSRKTTITYRVSSVSIVTRMNISTALICCPVDFSITNRCYSGSYKSRSSYASIISTCTLGGRRGSTCNIASTIINLIIVSYISSTCCYAV